MNDEENQKQVFPRRPQPLEIAARFPHSHRRDEAVEVENQKQVFPLSTATGWLFRPNSERRPGGGASLLLQAHCSIRKCYQDTQDTQGCKPSDAAKSDIGDRRHAGNKRHRRSAALLGEGLELSSRSRPSDRFARCAGSRFARRLRAAPAWKLAARLRLRQAFRGPSPEPQPELQ